MPFLSVFEASWRL